MARAALAGFDEMNARRAVGVGGVAFQRAQDVGRQPAVAGAGFDEIEILNPDSEVRMLRHFGDLHRQQFAEQRPDVDAGKKIARAARTLGGAGVVTELGVVERGSMNAATVIGPRSRIDVAIGNLQLTLWLSSLFLADVTKTSPSPRQTRMRAMRPDCDLLQLAAGFRRARDHFWPFTERMTSPCRSAPADGPFGIDFGDHRAGLGPTASGAVARSAA